MTIEVLVLRDRYSAQCLVCHLLLGASRKELSTKLFIAAIFSTVWWTLGDALFIGSSNERVALLGSQAVFRRAHFHRILPFAFLPYRIREIPLASGLLLFWRVSLAPAILLRHFYTTRPIFLAAKLIDSRTAQYIYRI